jgi:ubiquinone/menaquinone biosynthesis C-methylase UbiE
MSTGEAAMQAYYASRAGEYDAIYAKPERQSDLRAIEHWLAPQFNGATVLEIACGTGYWTQFIAPVAARMVAIETAPETLRIARGRVAADTVDFHVGDAYALPPALGGFNAAFAGFWFSHVPKGRRQAFLRGLAARLLPGARVVLLDNLFVAGSSSPIADTDAGGNTFQMRRLGDGSSHRVLKNFPSEAELRSFPGIRAGTGNYRTWQHYWAFDYEPDGH